MKARVVANSIALALVAVLTPALAFAQASITGVVRDRWLEVEPHALQRRLTDR